MTFVCVKQFQKSEFRLWNKDIDFCPQSVFSQLAVSETLILGKIIFRSYASPVFDIVLNRK